MNRHCFQHSSDLLSDCGIPVVSSNITHIANLTILGNWTVLADLINPGNFTFGNLSHVVSGNMVLTGTTYEQLATFSCFVGFMITGSNVSLCGSNGDWSSEVPVCRLIGECVLYHLQQLTHYFMTKF